MIAVLIVIIFVALCVWAAITSSKHQKAYSASLKAAGLDKHPSVLCGNYVGGHPELDIKVDNVKLTKSDDDRLVFLMRYLKTGAVNTRAFIPIADIKNIEVEDSSTIERKMTMGRIFLVGIYALGWQKKKKNELAFVTVGWADGRFEHETLFSFEGRMAMTRANTCRNALIKLCR